MNVRTSHRRRRAAARAHAVALTGVALLVVVAAGACRAEEPEPATQPAPDVTTFEPGKFDDLPLFPRSDPLGPRTDEDGVVARSYRAVGTTAREVVEYYRSTLATDWTLASAPEQLGPRTYRADWVTDEYRLRVSATEGETLESGDTPSAEEAVQYSLTLRQL